MMIAEQLATPKLISEKPPPPPEQPVSVQKIIAQVSDELKLPLEVVKSKLDVHDGARLIHSKKLDMNESQLGRMLYIYRKRIFKKHISDINKSAAISDVAGLQAYERVKQDYGKLYQLHAEYRQLVTGGSKRETEQALQNVISFLEYDSKDAPAFVSSIDNFDDDNFLRLLPQFLTSFTPQELEVMYAINTLFRKKILLELWRKSGRIPIQVQGSLVRGNCRAFGNWRNWLEVQDSGLRNNDEELQQTGSDLDFLIAGGDDMKQEGEIESILDGINAQSASYGIYLNAHVNFGHDVFKAQVVPIEVFEKLDMRIPNYLDGVVVSDDQIRE